MEQQLDFMFMVFQANPQKDSVGYWIDGEKVKRLMKRDRFYELIKNKQPELLKDAYEACITYSFYLWSVPGKTITHLVPKSDENTPYPDSLNTFIMGKPQKRLIKEKTTIQEALMGYGFSVPTNLSVQNLQVTLQKQDTAQEGFLSRFLNKRRTPNKELPKNMFKTK